MTKRTLYYHFESKDQLLAKVLEDQHHLALAAFKTFGDRLSGSPQAIVDGLFRSSPCGRRSPGGPVQVSRGWSSSWPTCPVIRRG